MWIIVIDMASKYGVSSEKEERLTERMQVLGIEEDDLVEKFILGSGSGGQKINKTASCVYLQHKSSAIEIKCQKTRSQALNRYYARVELCERLENEKLGKQSKRQQEIAKVKRQKRRRSRRAKEKMLSDKHKRSETKKNRSPVKQGRDD